MSLYWDDVGAESAPWQDNPSDVLAFGGNYIHCGQPMTRAGAEVRRISSTYEEKDRPDPLAVYLATRVLRCCCGFQMEIPDHSHAGNPDPNQEPAE